MNHTTRITTVGDDVFISLPDDAYIKLTPEQARSIAAKLFIKANEAEGLAKPEVIVLKERETV